MLTTSPHLKASIYTLLFSKQTYLSNTPLPCFILGMLHLLNMNKITATVYRLKFYFCKNYNRKITWCRKTAKYLDALYFLFGDRDLKCRKPKLMNIG